MAECAFVDGPAAGLKLELRRYPVFLRLVHNPHADLEWDALDQLDDAPLDYEDVYVYRRIDWGHARGFGWYATYLHVTLFGAQPTQVRDTPRWRALVDELDEEHPEWVRSAGQPEQEDRMAEEEKLEGDAALGDDQRKLASQEDAAAKEEAGVDKLQDAEVDPGRDPDAELQDDGEHDDAAEGADE